MNEHLPDRALRRLLDVAAENSGEPAAALPPMPQRYELVREIGRGGMGVVFEAIDHQLGRRCAVKTLGAGADDELRRRFAREALAAASLRHPHICAVHDATPDFISMQLIAGCPIDAVHRGERRLLVELVRDAARALHHAHEHGIVHRDLKPSNLLVEGRHVFVVDFGLAKAIDTDASLSLAGAVLGTPAFMPPEQALGRNERIDARSDVYGLGATLYRCLAGRPPFAATDLPTLLRAVIEDEPAPLGVEADLDVVVGKCLAKDPDARYPTASALADDLDRWLRDEPVQARAPSLLYRLRKRLQRQRSLWRAAAFAALGASCVVAVILVPIWWSESVASAAANEAVLLADHTATDLEDAAVHLRFGDLEAAQKALDAGIARASEFLTRHDVPRARYLLCRLLRARGRDDEALTELERTLAGDPSLGDARFERGLLLAAARDPTPAQRSTAIADLTAGIGEHSVLKNVDLLFGRAELARLEHRDEQAMDLFAEVLEYEPTHIAARTSLAHTALALGKPDLARYYSASAIDVQQGYGPVYFARERQTLPTSMLGLDGALVDFAPTLHDAPDNALALAHHGLVKLRRALRHEAEGHLAEALAMVLAAITDHGSVLTLHDDLPGALNNRAVCRMAAERLYARTGDASAAAAARTDAEADLARALTGPTELPEARCNLGLCALRAATVLRALGRAEAAAPRVEQAIAAFTRALAIAPPDWPHAPLCRTRLAAAEALRSPR